MAKLALDRLEPGAALQVIRLDGMQVGQETAREPHRHDYHEPIWVLSGADLEMKFNQMLGSGNMLVSDKVKLSLDISAVKQS